MRRFSLDICPHHSDALEVKCITRISNYREVVWTSKRNLLVTANINDVCIDNLFVVCANLQIYHLMFTWIHLSEFLTFTEVNHTDINWFKMNL